MPYSLLALTAVNEPSSIERLVIEERIHLLNLFLELCVLIRIRDRTYLKVHMELGSCRLSVLLLHMMTAERDRIGHVLELIRQRLRSDPRRRVLTLIVIAIHHDAL